jgi:serine/threonine-protein kinase
VDDPSNDPTVLAGSDELTGKTIGRFQITALLGKGGMGEVYLAEDSLLKRSVAVKRVSTSLRSNPHYRELLIKEAARASQLNDEHVAHIHDVVEHQGEILLVMEYVDGQSLRHRTSQPMPLNEFIPIAIQCTEALVAAHQSGIMHRDIKPENIMITTKGRVKICDFGLAQQGTWIEETGPLDRTPTVGFRGTPAYMAPEALLNRDPDFRADMFSLGIVFYELLTGKHPFRDGNNHIATADRVIHAAHVPAIESNRSIPRAISTTIDKMLSKSPTSRYASPEELLLALRSVRFDQATTPRQFRKAYAIWALLLASFVAAILGVTKLNRNIVRNSNTPHRNLVILPFRAVGDTKEVQPYSDGLTETLTARLSQLASTSDLAVIPASEVRARNVHTAEDAAKQFSANLILAGILYQSTTQSRLTYSLYEVGTLRNLKADTIPTDSSNPFTLENEVVHGITAALGIAVTAGSTDINPRDRTSVAEAYGLYLEGRGYLQGATDRSRLDIAVQAFQRAKDLDQSYAPAYASLGEAYWAKYQATKEAVWVELARDSCERADQLNQNSAESKNCLGTVDLGTGQFERAIGDFQRALQIEPTNDAAYLGLASGYEKKGNQEAAETTFKKAIEVKPNYYLGHVRLGQFYLRRGRFSDATEEFQKEIALVPNSEQAYLRVGAAYIYSNRYEDAITVLRKSIEIRPTAAAYSNIGSSYFGLRRFDDAVAALEQAAELVPRDFRIIGNLGRAYFWSTNQHNKAAGAYQRAIELGLDNLSINPRNGDAHILLARYYAMSGKKTEALNHLNQALTLGPTDSEYQSIGAIVYNQFGDRTAALQSLRKALALGWSVKSIKNEIEFDNLRMDPEFLQLTEG